jgi:hypothetical protein
VTCHAARVLLWSSPYHSTTELDQLTMEPRDRWLACFSLTADLLPGTLSTPDECSWPAAVVLQGATQLGVSSFPRSPTFVQSGHHQTHDARLAEPTCTVVSPSKACIVA